MKLMKEHLDKGYVSKEGYDLAIEKLEGTENGMSSVQKPKDSRVVF